MDLTRNNIRSIETITENHPLRIFETEQSKNISIDISQNPLVCDTTFSNRFMMFLKKKMSMPKINVVKIITECTISEVPIYEFTNFFKKLCPPSCYCEFDLEKEADLVDCSFRDLMKAPSQLFSFQKGRSIYLNLTGNKLNKLPNKDQPNYNVVTELYASYNHIESIDESNIFPNLKVYIRFL